MGRAVQQREHYHQIVLGTGDRPRQVLVLLVKAVEERQLLGAVSRIVERVDVERQAARWRRRHLEIKHC